MPAKTCEVCGRPEGDWGQVEGTCLRHLTYDGLASQPYVLECYRRGYEQQKKRADDLENQVATATILCLNSKTRFKIPHKVDSGVEYDYDMVTSLNRRFPGPVGVRAANAVHAAASHRLGAQYNGVLTIPQIQDLPLGRLSAKTLAALQWLVGPV